MLRRSAVSYCSSKVINLSNPLLKRPQVLRKNRETVVVERR